ncbi:MAG: hypothetical protein AB1898_05650 [Acidobacteriota bacterium]
MLEALVLLILSILLGVGSLVLTGWLVATHQAVTMDGLFLTLVCLVLALVFFLNAWWTLRSKEFQEILTQKKRSRETDSAREASARPS